MYEKSAQFYDAIYHFKDYGAASSQILELINERNPNAKTLLDVACGTGKHLEILRVNLLVEGLDLSPELLAFARDRCPEIPFHQADMVDFKLDHSFDVIICLFSSIGYVKTVENLYRAITCMANHLQPNGLLVLEPWFSPENYWIGRVTANYVDQPNLKITWMYISEIKDHISILDINFLVGTPEYITHFIERHEMGLFTQAEYQEAFLRAGLEVVYNSKGLFGQGVYLGKKPETF